MDKMVQGAWRPKKRSNYITVRWKGLWVERLATIIKSTPSTWMRFSVLLVKCSCFFLNIVVQTIDIEGKYFKCFAYIFPLSIYNQLCIQLNTAVRQLNMYGFIIIVPFSVLYWLCTIHRMQQGIWKWKVKSIV